MSSTQKRGFRLPWAAERDPDDSATAALLDSLKNPKPGAVSDDLGEGPFGRAEPTPPVQTTDAAPAAPDVPEVSAEAEMLETESPTQDRLERAAGDVWPTSDRSDAAEQANDGGPAAPAPRRAESEARVPRRENPLVAGLVKAMREAALASRSETTTRLQAEASARIEAIRASSTHEAAALRKRVDEDIAGIREWSKVEMARIRAETEHRIESRRAEAIAESQRHLSEVEELVVQVQGTVNAFEADMDRFFEQLLAESDPARLAALAEQAPDPPDLGVDVPFVPADWADASPVAEATTAAEAEAEAATETEATAAAEAASETEATAAAEAASETEATAAAEAESEADAGAETETATVEIEADSETAETEAAADPLEAADAAEAEAEATEGIDMAAGDQWPAAVLAAARRGDAMSADASPDGVGHSRLLVSGLTSVAGISAFKGAVGQLPGVRSVSVSSGERGVFIFTVSHESDTDIAEAVSSLTNFAVRITEASDESVSITAHEPAA